MTADRREAADRKRAVVVAGHRGDVMTARDALTDVEPSVRIAALGALERCRDLSDDELVAAFDDVSVGVRRRAAELAATHASIDLVPLLRDDDPTVVEIAAWACGEHESNRTEVVDELVALASHDDAIVRESAVAALGAIGDERAVPTIVAAATGDKPAVRRRAVLALAPFDGPDVDDALASALDDRDWQVRQAAEDLAPGAEPDSGAEPAADQPRS